MGAGGWELVTRAPSSGLRGSVLRLQDYAEHTPGGVARRELPAPQVTLIVSLGAPVEVVDRERPGGPPLAAGTFVAALDERPATAITPEGWRGVQVDLSPPAAAALLREDLGRLTGEVAPLEDVLGAGATRRLEAALRAASGPGARLEAAERFVAARLQDSLPAPDAARAWALLTASGGRIPVADLAREVRCSPRHLGSRFARHVGVPPKRAARLVRFSRAVAAITGRPDLPLARIAAACGYADQAHMTREVRALAGEAPRALRARALPGGAGLAA